MPLRTPINNENLVEEIRRDLVDVVALVDAAHVGLDSIPRDIRKAIALVGLALASAEAALARVERATAAEDGASSSGDHQH